MSPGVPWTPGHAFVDVPVPAFDQAVGVENGGGARRQADESGGVPPPAGAERGPGGVLGAADGAVLVPYENRQVPGGRVDELSFVRVVDGVHAGCDLAGGDLGGEAVEELDHLMGRQVQSSIGSNSGTELTHGRSGAHAAAHYVADDEGRTAGPQGDNVVPVATRVGVSGLVGGSDAEIVGLLQLLWEQWLLKTNGRLVPILLGESKPLAQHGNVVVQPVGVVHGCPEQLGARVYCRRSGVWKHASGNDACVGGIMGLCDDTQVVSGVSHSLLFTVQGVVGSRQDLVELVKSAVLARYVVNDGVSGDHGQVSSVADQRLLADVQQIRLQRLHAPGSKVGDALGFVTLAHRPFELGAQARLLVPSTFKLRLQRTRRAR